MKNKRIAIICLAPLALALTYGFFKSNNCLSEEDVESIYKLAEDKEVLGKKDEAYRLYKQIDIYACENIELRSKAFEKAVILKNKTGLQVESS